MYAFETFSLTLGEEHRLTAIPIGVLKISGYKEVETAGAWRKMLNEGLCNMYC
jgi:hypothetical protein